MNKINKYKMISILIFITLITFIFSLKNKTSQNLEIETSNIKQNNLVSIKLQNDTNGYDNSNSVPTSGYQLNATLSICKVGETKQDVTITYENGKINISNLTTNKTKCEIYFDKQLVGKDLILSKNTIDTSRKSGYFTSAFTANTAGKIFSAQDDDGTTYFFAGSDPNNYVSFADKTWRIIRINGDGSIRIIHNSSVKSNSFNGTYSDNAYVGYMYGTAGSSTYVETHANTTSSTIKTYLDTWYNTNLKINYENYIDANTGFCGDRKVENYFSGFSGNGVGDSQTNYAPLKRAYGSRTATYKCSNSNDYYTTKESTKGNKALANAIGLITIDEVMYAGGYEYVYGNSYNHWLKTGQDYWTMSPYYFSGYAYEMYVGSEGGLRNDDVKKSFGVRPVINLKTDALTTGSGTTTDPYRMS